MNISFNYAIKSHNSRKGPIPIMLRKNLISKFFMEKDLSRYSLSILLASLIIVFEKLKRYHYTYLPELNLYVQIDYNLAWHIDEKSNAHFFYCSY